MARKKLHYVYVGNMWGGEGEDTNCGNCGKPVVERRGFAVSRIRVVGGHCELCGGRVPIVGT
jgi:pyruvate formate lyase activating enzyme